MAPPTEDADGFPLIPPLPDGRQVAVTARSLARLVATIGTAVLSASTDEVAAAVVFAEREPIDGFAQRPGGRVIGPDALDEIADVPMSALTVTEVNPELALVVGSYFLPTQLSAVPASMVVAEPFVLSLARPGQRGCVLVRAGDDLGLVFVADGRVLLGYRAGGPIGGLEQVASLLATPQAALWARLGPIPEGRALSRPERPAPTDTAPPRPRPLSTLPPPPPPAPVAGSDVLVPRSKSTSPRPVAPPPPPPPASPQPAPARPQPSLVEEVLSEVRSVLGPHTVRVEDVFRQAEPTPAGLTAAAEALPDRRYRLISRATLEEAASRAKAAVRRAAPEETRD